TDTLKPDSTGLKFTVPDVFRMPVTIRIGTSHGDVTYRTMLNAREQTIDVHGVSSAPTMVIFDDGNTVLKELDFPQPTAWLVAQLQHDSNLWAREWVIEQLAARPDDREGAAALADAAVHADYFLTREQAVDNLLHAPAAVAVPAGRAALRDTSAAVRESAIS